MPISPASGQPGTARIPVRSHRQALDWGLVLISQGIESTIDTPADGSGWGLLVDSRQCSTALQTLRQYQVENRGWPWQQTLTWREIHFHWGSLLWALVLIVFYAVSSADTRLEAAGVMNISAVLAGQWWRVFTAMLLHADLAHLATNLSIGIVLLGLAMGRYGAGLALLSAFLAGAAGNVASLLCSGKGAEGLGASGMVMGALGLLAAPTLSFGRRGQVSAKYVLVGVAAGVMLFALFGSAPGTDIVAHLGGFIVGLILGTIISLLPLGQSQQARFNLFSGLVLSVIFTLSWCLALYR